MDAESDYFKDLSRLLHIGLKKYNKTEKNLEECTEILREWVKNQPHLPEVPNDRMIMNLLLVNKFSIENTKRKIDMFYTVRNLFPEFFKNKHPLSSLMEDVNSHLHLIPLPRATEEGLRVLVYSIRENGTGPYNLIDMFANAFNVAILRFNEDTPIGDIHIIDFKNTKMNHLIQVTPTIMKKVNLVVEEAFTNITKQVHCINYPPFAEPVLSLIRQIVKPKIAQRFHFHKDLGSIAEFVPLNILPKDYGGEELPLHELNEKWRRKYIDHKKIFDDLDSLQVKEELRPAPLTNNDMLGFHGNFMKLDVD